MAQMTVKDAAGVDTSIEKPLAPGRAVAANSRPVTLSNEDFAAIDGIEASLNTLADSVTSSRVDTNPIAGQVGVTAGSGTVDALTQRVVLATDVALPAGTNAIGKLAANSGVDIGDVDVASLPALVAGSAIIGKVGIDQTTPGTTNLVSAAQSGTWNVGTVTAVTAVTSITNALPAGTNMIGNVTPEGTEYETVAASQTAQTLGATGATGDYIASILVIPATTAPGNVLLLDNATSITVFTGGAASVSNLVPFTISLGIKSVSGAWKITTGANVSCIGIGNFT
jgi:hypothetical protein